MSESLSKKSRLLYFAAIGASALGLNGCVCANIANTSSFVFGCPPETPNPAKTANYTSLPGDKGKINIKLLCVNPSSGAEVAPLQIDERSTAFQPTVPGERQYEIDANYGVNIANGRTTVAQPDASTLIIRGDIVNFEGVNSPALVSVNHQSGSEFLGRQQ